MVGLKASNGMVSLAEVVSADTDYLSRSTRCPQLSQTSVTFMLQSHYNSKSIDGSEETLKVFLDSRHSCPLES